MQKIKVKSWLVQKLEWKQMDGLMDTTDCVGNANDHAESALSLSDEVTLDMRVHSTCGCQILDDEINYQHPTAASPNPTRPDNLPALLLVLAVYPFLL